MKAKLKDYIDIIFTDAPRTHRAHELKEEMYTDLCEKYDDLVAEGKTPAAAYHAVVSGVGDIGELIEELRKEAGMGASEPVREAKENSGGERFYTAEEREAMRKYKNRCAVMSAVAVAMYILCWLPLVLLSVLIENSEVGSIVGLVVMFVMIAAATSLFIIQGMTKPEFMREKAKDDDEDDDDDDDTSRNKKGEKHPVYKAISGALWCLTVVVYLGVSFLSGAWHITWLIFLIAAAIDNIIKACFELRS